VPRVSQELACCDAKLLAGGKAAQPPADASRVAIARRDLGEATVGAGVARVPDAASDRYEVIRMRVDDACEGRVGDAQHRAKLNYVVAQGRLEPSEGRSDQTPCGVGGNGSDDLGAHGAQRSPRDGASHGS